MRALSIPKKPNSFTNIEKKYTGILTANAVSTVTFKHLYGTAMWYLNPRNGGKCQHKSKAGTQFFQTAELTIHIAASVT